MPAIVPARSASVGDEDRLRAIAAFTSSRNQRWQTPEWFLDLVREIGPIAFDPATAPDNPTGAARFLTEYDHGLIHTWPTDGLVYCNPPYGRHLSGDVDPSKLIIKTDKDTGIDWIEGFGTGWAAKMAQHDGEATYLVPARPETEWWRTLFDWCDMKLFWSSPEYGARINFVDPASGKKKNGSSFPNSVFYRGPNVAQFCRVFGPHGTLVPGGSFIARILEELL